MTTTEQTLPVTIEDIRIAAERIAPYIHRTPLLTSAALNRMTGADFRLKGEHLQRSGSFKLRGALNKLLSLTEDERRHGVVAFSSGNHAQGVALAAKLIGIRATIVMPSDAPTVKLEATRDYGATIVLYDRQREDREAIARRIAKEQGAVVVPPFDDPHVIAGQGTVGLEIAEEWPEVEVALIPIGGGGLISGIATALKALRPEIEVIGVEPAIADDARQSLAQGEIVRIAVPPTIADGVATTAIGQLPFAIMRQLVDQIVTVSEDEIVHALKIVLTRTKQVVEPTGALSTAAALADKVDVGGRKVVSLLCGGNLDLQVLQRLYTGSDQEEE
jgi:threonine ammonia-lyase medium form